MSWIVWTALAVLAVGAAVYIMRPMWLVAAVIGTIRRWGRMRAKSVDADGIIWPYLEGGPAEGEVVVMVHGFGGDKDNWPLYARHFTKRYRVVAPDLPGFGQNVRDPALNYGVDAQSERLHAFVAALGIETFHLAGNSMGGFIALNYALNYPQQLKTLTLIDNAGVTSVNKSELELAIAAGRNPLVATSLEEFDRLLDFIMHKRIPSPKFMKKAMLAIHERHHDLLNRIFWTLAEEALEGSLTRRLKEVAVPTLILWGKHDRLLDVSCATRMAAAIPDNRLVVFEDAGHVPMIECPRAAAAQQLRLLIEAA